MVGGLLGWVDIVPGLQTEAAWDRNFLRMRQRAAFDWEILTREYFILGLAPVTVAVVVGIVVEAVKALRR